MRDGCIAKYGRSLYDPGPFSTLIKVRGGTHSDARRWALADAVDSKDEMVEVPGAVENYGRRMWHTIRDETVRNEVTESQDFSVL